MTDPHDPSYTDEKSVRDELTRVFDVCRGCRSCVDLCDAFPTLFDLIDGHRRNVRTDDRDEGAGGLAPFEQDQVIDACHQCRRCATDCPYTPDLHELAVDVPRLMLRAAAMRRSTGQVPPRSRRAARVLGRLGAVRRVPGARLLFAAPVGSTRRRLLTAITGVTSTRPVPSFARETFSSWFAGRAASDASRSRSVAVVPTCVVEFHAPEIGRDLVRVYEHRGIGCSPASIGCCGAVALHAGDVDRFVRQAEANVSMLAEEVRRGRMIVVAQPTCCAVIRVDYLDHVGPAHRGDAQLVAARTVDAIEYLVRADPAVDPAIDLTGAATGRVVHHVSSQLTSIGAGSATAELLVSSGGEVEPVAEPSGVTGPWGLRADHDACADRAGARLAAGVTTLRVGAAAVVGDDHLANLVIADRTGIDPEHPLRLIARADGIARDD